MNRHNPIWFLMKGIELAFSPGIRLFVIFPLVINIISFSIGFYFLFSRFDIAIQALSGWLPSWLDWLTYLLWPLMVIITIIGAAYLFGTIANFISAPFNGLLAEKVEERLTGQLNTSSPPFIQIVSNTIRREWQKLKYWLPRAIFCLCCFFIPVAGPIIAPWIWIIFSSWMMAIQYADYPYDNHQIKFHDMQKSLTKKRWLNFSFGGLIMMINSIPLLNLIIIPVAVCAATAMWVEQNQTENIK